MTLKEVKKHTDIFDNVYLQGAKNITLPDGLSIGGGLDLRGAKNITLPDGLSIGGCLDLRGAKNITLPDGLSIGVSLNLQDAKNITLPSELSIGGCLDLTCAENITLPDGLSIGVSLNLQDAKNITLPDGLSVGGCLDLTCAENITLPDGLSIGVSLILQYAENITLPDGLSVGGNLYLQGAKNITLPSELSIGGGFNLTDAENITLPDGMTIEKYWNTIKHLKNGDVVKNKYVYADNILTLIKGEKRIGDYIFYIGRIPQRNVIYDGDNYAHCRSFKEGVLDLNFKKAKDRDAEQYQKYTLDSEVSHDEAVTMYRIITGACAAGTQQFIDNNPTKIKDKYTVREMIEITTGAYGGAVFANFF